jgi:hypothetical protein
MTKKNVLGWRQYRGKIIPRSEIDRIAENYRPYDTRLKLGDRVFLRVDDLELTQFISSVVVDVAQSHSRGATYALALPATPSGDFYIVADGFSGTGMNLNDVESAEASGIYTQVDYELYLAEIGTPVEVIPAERTLRLVTSAIDEARTELRVTRGTIK